MTKFKDIVALSEEAITDIEQADGLAPDETEVIERRPRDKVKHNQKEFIRFEDKEVDDMKEFIKNLKFQEKLSLLFEKGSEEGGQKKGLMQNIAGIVMVIFIVSSVLYLTTRDLKKDIPKAESPLITGQHDPAIEDIARDDIGYFPENEWENVTNNIRAEISIYRTEEVRKIRDYLDVRANRGSTMTTIKTQRAKKENTYQYLTQNRAYFRDKPDEYTKVEEEILQAIAFSDRVMGAFSEKNTAVILRTVIGE